MKNIIFTHHIINSNYNIVKANFTINLMITINFMTALYSIFNKIRIFGCGYRDW